MKIALVYDGIFCRSGGERVLLCFHKSFPEAPIYTSIYVPQDTYPELKECDIRTTWFNKIIKNEKEFKTFFYPLGFWSMEMVDLSDYDIVIMITTHCAKYVKVSPDNLTIAYCFTPFRLAWNPDSYSIYSNSKFILRFLLNIFIKHLRKIDYKHSRKINKFITLTNETAERIRKAYKVENEIIIQNSSIDTTKFYISDKIDDYYLVVSRLEKYKKVDIVIEAFNRLKLPLKIVGRGIEKENLKKLANPNIEFLEGLSDKELSELYSHCKAFIFPQHEDFGSTPIEANASGRPVIAYGKGGALETLIPYNGNNDNECTAVFFYEQTPDALIEAIKTFEKVKFNPQFIKKHSEKFDDKIFIEKIKNIINIIYQEWKNGKLN